MNRKQPNLLILLAGFFTSGAALVVVALSSLAGFNIMGLTFVFIIPAGAIIVGLMAGSGYAIASKMFNVKIRHEFILILLLAAVITFGLSHYVTYLLQLRQMGYSTADLSFLEYFRHYTESTTIQSSKHSQPATPIGAWGYLFQVLQLIGFALGSVVPALVLGGKPYCENCQLYMSKVETIYHQSYLNTTELKAAKGKKEKMAVLEQAVQEAMGRFSVWWERDQSLTWPQLEERLDHYEAAKRKQTLAFVQCDFFLCDSCEHWHVIAQVQNVPLTGHAAPKQILDSRTQPRLPPVPPPPPPVGGGQGIQRFD